MEQEEFNKIVDLLPYIVFGGAAFFTLLILSINWLIEKNTQVGLLPTTICISFLIAYNGLCMNF